MPNRLQEARILASIASTNRSYCGGIEGMIPLQYPWQNHNGASHRKNLDTPPLTRELFSSLRELMVPTELRTLSKHAGSLLAPSVFKERRPLVMADIGYRTSSETRQGFAVARARESDA